MQRTLDQVIKEAIEHNKRYTYILVKKNTKQNFFSPTPNVIASMLRYSVGLHLTSLIQRFPAVSI